jgi:peptidoglycan/xylan/chitin deacetylase (PgdA/CDA1 family)
MTRLFALAALLFAFLAPAANADFILYVSPASRKLLEQDAVDLKTRANRWRNVLIERKAAFTIVTHPAQLAKMPPRAALVLPSAAHLSAEERRVILQRLEAGDSILATWMPDTLDEKGAAIAPTFVEQVFKVSTKVAPPSEKGFLITVGDTPLTFSLPAGSRLWVGNERRYPTPLLATTGAGYLSDWSRVEGDTGLLAFTTVGQSRRALIGYTEAAWDEKAKDFVNIAQRALDWVEGRPIAYLRNWPYPYRGAVTVGVDALWRFENVPRIAEVLNASGTHASFHFLPSDAAANAALIRQLLKSGHSLGGFGDAAQPFAGQAEAEQRARVERMVQGFRSALDASVPVNGLRAPQGATDAATEKAAEALDYLVDTGRIDSAVPMLSANRRLVLLPANTNIDSNASADSVNAGLDAAARRAQLLAGYSFVGIDVAGFQQNAPIETGLPRFIANAKREMLWTASAAEVASWWREHEQIQVATSWDAASSSMVVDVTVAEAMPFPAAIEIVPPAGRKASLEATVAGAQLEASSSVAATLVLTGLPPGRHRLQVRFQP